MNNNTNSATPPKVLNPLEVRRGSTLLLSALALAIIMPLILSSGANGFFFKLFLVIALSGVYATVLSSNLIPVIKLLPALSSTVSVVFFAYTALSGGTISLSFIGVTVIFVGFLLSSAALGICAVKKYSKTEMLIGSSVSVILTGIFGVVCSFICTYGHISTSLVREKVSLFFETLQETTTSLLSAFIQSPEFANASKYLSQATQSQTVDTQELLTYTDEFTSTLVQSMKISLPGLIIVFAMMFASAAVFCFTALAGFSTKQHILGKGYFEYRISGFTARVYNTILFISMLGTFIGLPAMVLTVCINLLVILVYPLAHIGIRQFCRFLKSKRLKPILATLITVSAVISILLFFGGFAMLAMGFAGVFFISAEESKQHNP